MTWLQRGTAEPLKADLHAAMEGLAAVFCVYNALAWIARTRLGRQEWHLLGNVVIYAALVTLEDRKRRHHGAGHDD